MLAPMFKKYGLKAIPALSKVGGKSSWNFDRWMTVDEGYDFPTPMTRLQMIENAANGPALDVQLPPQEGTVLTLQFTFPFEGRKLPRRFFDASRAIEGDPKYYSEFERLAIRNVLKTFDHRRDEHALLLAYGLMLQARATASRSAKQIMFVDVGHPTRWEAAALAKAQSPDIWLGMWLVMGIILLDGLAPPNCGDIPFQKWLVKRANTRIRSITFAKVGLGQLGTTAKKNLRFDLAPGAWIPTPSNELSSSWWTLKAFWRSKNFKKAFLMVYDDPVDVDYLSSVASLSPS